MFRPIAIQERRRSRWAVFACGLWLLGFDVAPLAHVLFHESLGHHHHDAHHSHHHDDDGNDETPSEHGHGSLAHRDLAAQVPTPGVPFVQEALLAWSSLPTRSYEERPVDRRPRATKARGPPARMV